MRDTHNRRSMPRVPAGGLDAIFQFGGQVNTASVLDLSLGGALLRTDVAPPVGTDTDITFGTGHRSVIRALARVVGRDRVTRGLRLCFVRMRGADRARLRRLVVECRSTLRQDRLDQLR